jgi:hypothetical protein
MPADTAVPEDTAPVTERAPVEEPSVEQSSVDATRVGAACAACQRPTAEDALQEFQGSRFCAECLAKLA